MKNDNLKAFGEGVESRSIVGSVELDSEGETPKVVGEGVVFNQWTEIRSMFGDYMEMIIPTALDKCDMSDVVSCRDHQLPLLCSRTTGAPDDLVFTIDPKALRYSYTPKNDCARSVTTDIKLGFIKGSSFIFSSHPDTGSLWERRNVNGKEIMHRTIIAIDKIYEMGAVTFQAYKNATVSARSAAHLEEVKIPKPLTGAELREQYQIELIKK